MVVVIALVDGGSGSNSTSGVVEAQDGDHIKGSVEAQPTVPQGKRVDQRLTRDSSHVVP